MGEVSPRRRRGVILALHPVVQHHIVNTLGWRELRPLQEQSVEPVLAGEDALLLAPTAGGKTEAALFPMLTRMAEGSWSGTSVLYPCPLSALLNNLKRRVDTYAPWLGRSAAVRHGDTSQGVRRRIAVDRPDVLLTTPESLEAMLVSATMDPRILLGDVRAVVVDEVHAFAGDDRGWHLLAVLERLSVLTGRPLQRVGLSATVGHPEVRRSAARRLGSSDSGEPAVRPRGGTQIDGDDCGGTQGSPVIAPGSKGPPLRPRSRELLKRRKQPSLTRHDTGPSLDRMSPNDRHESHAEVVSRASVATAADQLAWRTLIPGWVWADSSP